MPRIDAVREFMEDTREQADRAGLCMSLVVYDPVTDMLTHCYVTAGCLESPKFREILTYMRTFKKGEVTSEEQIEKQAST